MIVVFHGYGKVFFHLLHNRGGIPLPKTTAIPSRHLVPSKDPSADNPDEYDRILANDTYKIVVFFHSPER